MFLHNKVSVNTETEYIKYQKFLHDKAILSTRVCPKCGESYTTYHHQYKQMMNVEASLEVIGIERHEFPIFKLIPIIGDEHWYSIIKCKCHTCGREWKSKPFLQ